MSLFRTLVRPPAVSHLQTLCTTLNYSTQKRGFGKLSKHKTRWKSNWSKSDAPQDGQEPTAKVYFSRIKRFAQRELKALVDYYGIEIDTEKKEEKHQDYGKLIWNVGDMHEPWPLRHEDDAAHVHQLEMLLKDDEASHDDVFDTYRKLNQPGVVYLRIETIRLLLHHLSIVERPSLLAMQRFLSVLDDMKTAHIHIIRSEWTSAIHLAGRAMGNVSDENVQSALHLWRDMENRAGVKGGFVTLNVLFNVAVKAGKFSMAEALLNELQVRKLDLHRHFRVSLLYYYGVLRNGNAVRRTYQQLVSAGDIVDTAVLNAVIAALIRAGEPVAAEHVFERMKHLHAHKKSFPHGPFYFNRTWRQRRLLGLHFTHEAQRLARTGETAQLKELQDTAPVAPNSRTYALLIRHQSSTVGNIDRVDELLKEMRYNSVPLEGTIFIVIFRGFNSFGGVRYTSWTANKLEKIWAQYLKALRQDLERTFVSSIAVIAALKAFRTCTNPRRTLQAWEEIRQFWQPNEAEHEDVMKTLRNLVPRSAQEQGFFDENPNR